MPVKLVSKNLIFNPKNGLLQKIVSTEICTRQSSVNIVDSNEILDLDNKTNP